MQTVKTPNPKKMVWLLATMLALLLVLILPQWFSGHRAVPADVGVGPVNLHLYSLVLFLAFVCGYVVSRRLARRFGYDLSKVDSMVIWVVVFGFAGARLHHVLTVWDYYAFRPFEIFYVWQGGLGIFGGIVGGVIGALFYCFKAGWPVLESLGLLPAGVALGQAVGRWGNFFNQEAFGKPAEVWWKMYVAPEHRPAEFYEYDYFHPVFLYESLAMLAIFAILYSRFNNSRDARKESLALYCIFYGLVRFLTEQLRTDAISIGGIYLNQIVALVFVACGLLLWWWIAWGSRIVGKTDI